MGFEPSLTDKHWRATLRERPAAELGSDLEEAIRTGNQWRFETILQLDPEDFNWRRFQRIAAEEGRVDMLRALLDQKKGSFKAAEDGITLLLAASMAGHLETVRYFVEELRVNFRQDDDIFIIAAANNHMKIVDYLIERGANPALSNGKALIEAATAGHLPMVERLVEAGVSVNIRGSDALWYATREGHADIIRFLLKAGAEADVFAFSPVREAFSNQRLDIVDIFFDHGVDVNQDKGRFLRDAVNGGHKETVAFLLKRGADPNLTDSDDSILDEASYRGNAAIVRMLLKAGADQRHGNFKAFREARRGKNSDVFKILKEREWEQRAEEAMEKMAEFRALFPSAYSFDDLRHKKGPSGDTGLLLAAKSGRFDDLLVQASGGAPPHLVAADLLHPDGKTDTVIAALAHQKKLQQFFRAHLWFPRKTELLQAYETLLPRYKKQVDFSAEITEMNHRLLRKKSKIVINKPPKI